MEVGFHTSPEGVLGEFAAEHGLAESLQPVQGEWLVQQSRGSGAYLFSARSRSTSRATKRSWSNASPLTWATGATRTSGESMDASRVQGATSRWATERPQPRSSRPGSSTRRELSIADIYAACHVTGRQTNSHTAPLQMWAPSHVGRRKLAATSCRPKALRRDESDGEADGASVRPGGAS